jgi:hypothetical protein
MSGIFRTDPPVLTTEALSVPVVIYIRASMPKTLIPTITIAHWKLWAAAAEPAEQAAAAAAAILGAVAAPL